MSTYHRQQKNARPTTIGSTKVVSVVNAANAANMVATASTVNKVNTANTASTVNTANKINTGNTVNKEHSENMENTENSVSMGNANTVSTLDMINTLSNSHLQDLSADEKELLKQLRHNYTETAKNEIELHRSIFVIEHSSDAEYLKIYEKRKAILEEFRRESVEGRRSALNGFWLKVLKGAGVELEDPEDELILYHLIDIRSRMFVQPNVRMQIEFEFEKNKYFTNTILTKTYYIKCMPEPSDAVFYDGIEITNMEGCEIRWLVSRNPSNVESEPKNSFFSYFDHRSENLYANRGVLDEEIAFGFFLREKVIPKAIFFFTGELTTEKESSEAENDNEMEMEMENMNTGRSSEAEEEYKVFNQSESESDEDEDEEKDVTEELSDRPAALEIDKNS